ncbi:aminodeoxychorismate lyase [Kribbella antibiotica]|uniref:Aminodeoxychorismate lyase n=1 Tax=Kribbella antibiotica TaxID=190195 RepID=A0A4R4ZV55_9ACTN|nr:aminotransferase class IV [Kribbella antibiotica]TDD62370.1 aminodeoxychorismate lyase [Kribbella antibiotica]
MTELLLLNGEPLHTVPPALLRATSYGHFSSMQVRGGRVDGLDLHFERLDRSSREVFGQSLPADRIRRELRLAAIADCSLRVNVFSGAGELDLLIRVSPPVEPATDPVGLRLVEHQRALPHLKHTGTFDLIYFGDDALFHTAAGEISEASIWNICFARGTTIVFPAAPVLNGIRQQVLQRGLSAFTTQPVLVSELGGYDAAYLTNSIDPALPVASIGDSTFAPHPESAATIAAAYATQEAQPI